MIDKSKDPQRYDELYFAAKEAKDVAGVALEKAQTFFNFLRYNSYINKIHRSWRFYHGAFHSSVESAHQIDFSGEQGELVMLPVNHYRNIAQHIYTMITANRPVMDARAVNTDAKSLAQATIANQILDYYMREKKLEEALKKATEMSIVLGAGYIKLAWNAMAGEIFDADPETGELNHEGELEFSTHSPLDVVVDGTREGWDNDWVIVRSYVNRYNLIAKYPELREKLLGVESKNQASYHNVSLWSNDDTDDVPVYEFFHRKTEAMPQGRYILFCNSETIMIDMEMPYRTIPIFRIAPSDIIGTPYGYTPMFDLMPIQENINALYSAIATNQSAFAVQNIFIQNGSNLNMSSLPGGLNIMEGNVKPEAVQLTSSPAEALKMIEMMEKNMEVLSGVNSVARGDPEKSLRSGTSLALVQSMALQYVSGLQQSYIRLIEDVGTAVIQILKDFATTPKTIALVGKYNQWELKQFTGEDVNSINRVIVDVGNPLSKTIAGRVQMAEQMLQMQIIKNPQQYIEVMNTGRLDVMYEGDQKQLLSVRRENERLMDGKQVHALATDRHKMHIEEHSSILSDPDLREDDNLTQVVLQHIQEHIDLLRNTDPALLMLMGEQPLPPIEAMMPQPPGGAPMPPGPGGGDGQINQDVLQESPSGDMMQPGSLAPPPPGETIQGPGGQGAPLPKPSRVPADLLPNPALQEQSMGNVK